MGVRWLHRGLCICGLLATILMACSSGDDEVPRVETPPLCTDLLREGAVLTDAQWQAGCGTGQPGGSSHITPARSLCTDGRSFYAYYEGAWGTSGEPLHVASGRPADDPEALQASAQCIGKQSNAASSAG